MGTELKNIVNSMNGVMVWLEIKEGKNCMRALKNSQALGGTVACILRGVSVKCTFTRTEVPSMEDDDNIDSGSLP